MFHNLITIILNRKNPNDAGIYRSRDKSSVVYPNKLRRRLGHYRWSNYSEFILSSLQQVCRVTAVKHHHSTDVIFSSFGVIEFI